MRETATDRYRDLRALAKLNEVDAIGLVPGPNFDRIYHQSFGSHERPMLIIIPVEGDPAAIVPNLELASFSHVNFEGAVFDWRDQTGYAEAFTALAAHMPLRSLAVEGQVMRGFVHHALMRAMPNLRIIDGEAAISGLRLVKTLEDIAALEVAIGISENALSDTIAQVKIGMSETEVENLLTRALFVHGADAHAFPPIVAAGDNSAMPHAHARPDYFIKSGDALLLDFGAQKNNFNADITRTVFVGEPSPEHRAIYETVLAANLRGFEVTRAGITAHEIDDAVTCVLEASPFADRIRTKTGHGLGREVHEVPYIMRGNHVALPAGCVFTNEPGLYQTGDVGIRIEDDVLVTEDGCRSLTSFPKHLMVIG